MRRLAIALASSAVLACGSPPQPPVVNPPGGSETITGAERIGWEQPAADAVELAATGYAIYVDGTRGELAGVTCAPAATSARFACTARLPPLGAGAHALQIASFIVDGSLLESARSGTLTVNVVPAAAAATPAEPSIRPGEIEAATGSRGRVDAIAGPIDAPVDVAVAPDGRLFVAERAGRIAVVRDGRVIAEPAIPLARSIGAPAGGQLIAVTLDPEFDRTHFVFVLYTSPRDAAAPEFVVARLRESHDTLGDPVVLLNGIASSAAPAGALRFGPDGRLYAAFDNGGDARRAGDAASPNGKVLRLNADGTTPADQPGGTPVFVSDLAAPVGLAWQPSNGALWIADRRDGRPAQLRAIAGSSVAAYALPADAQPTSLAFDRADGTHAHDTLLVGSDGAARLLRVAIDPRSMRPAGVERLLRDRVDVVRAIAVAPDRGIYFATSDSVGILTNAR